MGEDSWWGLPAVMEDVSGSSIEVCVSSMDGGPPLVVCEWCTTDFVHTLPSQSASPALLF